MKWTREQIEALADKFAQVFVETVEKLGGKATIVKDEGCPTLHEADAPLPCAICGKPNEIGDICEDCANKYSSVDDDDDNIPLAAGHGYGY